jgi:excisionase family DNA binding protein
MDEPVTQFFCVKEASAWSGLSLSELYRLARTGEIPHWYDGAQLRFHRRDLADFLAGEGAPQPITGSESSSPF